MKKVILLVVMSLPFAFSCEKEGIRTKENSQHIVAIEENNATTDTPQLVKAFAKTYGLSYLPYKPYINFGNDTASAGAYVRSTNAKFATTYKAPTTQAKRSSPQSQSDSGSIGSWPVENCNQAGTYYATIPGAAGMFSSFNITLTVNDGGAVSTSSIWISGMALGWSWSQLNSSSTCIWGTITWGVRVGGYTLGYVENYQFNVIKRNCSLYVTYGQNVCFH